MLSLCIARDDEDLLVVTGNGYGKRTPMADYPRKGRPTQGVRTIKVTDKKGELITARPVREGQELLLISMMGQMIRISVEGIRRTGRSTEGVRLMVMGDEDQVSGVAPVEEGSGPFEDEDEEDGGETDVVDDAAAGDVPDAADAAAPDAPSEPPDA